LKKKTILVTLLFLSILSAALLSAASLIAKAEYTATAKPMEFYLHHTDVPVQVAGVQTKYIINTSQLFKFQTQDEANANSFYKPPGLPKITVDFYLYPNLAGPVTIDGSWQVFLWINGSAYKPTTFALNFKEITIGGAVLWDSGATNPTVTSSVGSYTDVPVYNYNLSTQLTHAFNPDTTIQVSVEVNAGSSADTRIWYDSPLYPSKVILPAKDYARAATIKTYNTENEETTLFNHNWTTDQRKVFIRANVTNPFGGYDTYRVNATLLDPEGNPVIVNKEMTRTSNGQYETSYAQTYELNWSYPSTALLGNYTVIITVIDNNGRYRQEQTGSYSPFIEEKTQTFTIGIITYYDPTFLVTDDADDPLPEAQVYITWRNGTTDTLPRYTSINGQITLTQVEPGNYGFTILWKDMVVKQITIRVESNGPYTIKTQVYELTVRVLGNNGNPVHGAYVVVYTQSGIGYRLDITDSAGRATFKLPSGTYKTEAYYAADYWLTIVRTSATQQVTVTSSTTQNLVLTEYPPALWTTMGFLLLMGFVAAAAVASIIFVVTYRKARARRKS